MKRLECLTPGLHTPEPTLYLAWHRWAQAMTSNGWRQLRCSGCGCFKLWRGLKPMIRLEDYDRGCIGQRTTAAAADSTPGSEGDG